MFKTDTASDLPLVRARFTSQIRVFKNKFLEAQKRTEELFIERFRNDTYQPENTIDDVITDGVIANGVIADGESALIGIRIDLSSDETAKLMGLFGQHLRI